MPLIQGTRFVVPVPVVMSTGTTCPSRQMDRGRCELLCRSDPSASVAEVEAERVAGRIEQHPDFLLRLVLGQLGP